MSDKHPIATITGPHRSDLRRAAVVFAWTLRENLGEIERALGREGPAADPLAIDDIRTNSGLALGAKFIAAQADASLDTLRLLTIASHHCDCAAEHLRGYFAYEALLSRSQGSQTERLTELGANERTYASRSAQLGRQAAHRALAKMVEAWPDDYRQEEG